MPGICFKIIETVDMKEEGVLRKQDTPRVEAKLRVREGSLHFLSTLVCLIISTINLKLESILRKKKWLHNNVGQRSAFFL